MFCLIFYNYVFQRFFFLIFLFQKFISSKFSFQNFSFYIVVVVLQIVFFTLNFAFQTFLFIQYFSCQNSKLIYSFFLFFCFFLVSFHFLTQFVKGAKLFYLISLLGDCLFFAKYFTKHFGICTMAVFMCVRVYFLFPPELYLSPLIQFSSSHPQLYSPNQILASPSLLTFFAHEFLLSNAKNINVS